MIKVHQVWMENTTSRNAYYQVFQFTPDGGYDCRTQPVTVIHHGSLVGAQMWHRPVISGIARQSPGASMNQKVGAKLNRGYKTAARTEIDIQKNDKWFVDHFGAKMAFELDAAIFVGQHGEPVPREEPETVIVHGAGEVITDRPDSWGTW